MSAVLTETAGRVIPSQAEREARFWPLARAIFLLWLGTRAAYAVIGYLAVSLHLASPPPPLTGLLLAWQRWDAGWYMTISRLGYFEPSATNFFPLYPMAVGGVSWLLGDGSGPVHPQPDRLRLLVAMGWSNLALLIGLYALARLAEFEREGREGGAGMAATRIALAFPLALVWAVAYAESFFLALTALTLLFSRQRRWYLAAGTAFLAGLDRPLALALVLPLAWEFGRQQGGWRVFARPRQPSLTLSRLVAGGAGGMLAIGAAPAAIVAFFCYCRWRFGDFLLPVHSQFTHWNHVNLPPWVTARIVLSRLVHHYQDTNLLAVEAGLFVAFGLASMLFVRRLPFMYTLYSAGLLGLAVTAPVPSQHDLLWGTGRYLAEAVPIYLIAAGLVATRPWLEPVLTSGGLLVQGALVVALLQDRPIL